MKLLKTAAAALALVATPALADGHIAAGATVVGPQGNLVGTIESVADGQAVLDTGGATIAAAVERGAELPPPYSPAEMEVFIVRDPPGPSRSDQIPRPEPERAPGWVSEPSGVASETRSQG